jgi:hypothetical protein
MNDIFNFTRFVRLFTKHTAEHYKTYLMSTGVLVGVMVLFMGFVTYSTRGHMGANIQGALFFNFLFFSGTIFTSMVFSDLGDRKKSVPALTLPVSHLEKYLVAWLYSFVIFQLIYLACFYAIDFIMITVANASVTDKNEVIHVFSADERYRLAFPMFAVLHAVCFIGSIFFEKLHFIKTVFSFFILLLVLGLLNPVLMKAIFQTEISDAVPFVSVEVILDNRPWQILPNETGNIILLVTSFLIVMALWLGTYFRLKEKQV